MNNIGDRIKQRRLALGISMQDLVNRFRQSGVEITRASISKYENNKSIPGATILWNLAKTLETKPEYFFEENTISLQWLAFRKHSSLTGKIEDRIKNSVQEYMEGYVFLENIINPGRKNTVDKQYGINKIEDAETAAEKFREKIGISNWPIESVTHLLENLGFQIINYRTTEKKFDGLSGIANGSFPVIITKADIPVDRKRLNLAHELGHHILKIFMENEEKAAYRFAAAFLIPGESIFEELGKKRKNIDLEELVLLKEKYGISIQALTKRCYDLGVISESLYKNLFIHYRKNYWHVQEPGDCTNIEEPRYFKQIVLKALAEGVLTEEKAYSIFPDFNKMQGDRKKHSTRSRKDLRNLPEKQRNQILQSAAQMAEKDYADDNPDLSFNVAEDVYDDYV